MPRLVLGPMLRFVDQTTATIWVETDEPCRVSVLDSVSDTFTVHGHHFALVDITGLTPETATEYTVALDGHRVWPLPDSEFPASLIRTLGGRSHRLLFGTCRTSVPNDPPHVLSHGVDMLRAFALDLARESGVQWPQYLVMLGDQVYADEPPEEVREFIRDRRDTSVAPGEEVADFTEYAELYRVAWTEPAVRWLLSTVPVLMMFDDHDLRDDWNTSHAWQTTVRQLPWWSTRVKAGMGSYWVYQHLGNLSPEEREEDVLLTALRRQNGDGGAMLDDFAVEADRDPRSYRWSYARDFDDGTRLIMLDSRCARDLTSGARRMIDDVEWSWFDQQATGDIENLLIGSSLPILLPTGLHYVESWNEAVSDGAWGRRAAKAGEWIRQTIDLEHWAAFRRSFDDMATVIKEVASGKRGKPPRNIVFLSGDVHFSYLAQARIKGSISSVHQIVCSPMRNPLNLLLRIANAVAAVLVAGLVGWVLARTAGVHRSLFGWRIKRGPWFSNSVATLRLDKEQNAVEWFTTKGRPADERPDLVRMGYRDLADRRRRSRNGHSAEP